MKGTSASHTLAIDLIPPRITKAVSRHRDARDPWSDVECFIYHRGNGVCVHHIPNAECRYGGKNGEDYSKPFLFHASLEDIHRTACHQSVVRFYAVFNGKECLGVLCGDAEDTCQPHPEHSSWATGCDSRRNTDDVTGAYGGGQCSG